MGAHVIGRVRFTGIGHTLIEEIPEFSPAGHRALRMQLVFMKPLIEKVATREGGDNAPELRIPPGLTAIADPSSRSRALWSAS